jgi:hypothetical protein
MNPDWKDYERQIFHTLHSEYSDSEVIYDLKITGEKSQQKRQIDVGIKQKRGEKQVLGIAECKYLKRKIDVMVVDALIGKMHDVGASFGIIISAIGHTDSAKNLADKSRIQLKIIPYEFLKDYGFVPANWLADVSEVFQQEVEYPMAYCKKCGKTNLYEIKVVRGFAEFDKVKCPECRMELFETRTDGEYRVIKRFNGRNISENDVNKIIVDHLIWTRQSWDRLHSNEGLFLNVAGKLPSDKFCSICHKHFDATLPGSNALDYGKNGICLECFMSKRTLLIDFGKL